MKKIYLDNNATTKIDRKVKQKMMPFFDDFFANPSSTGHFLGQQASHFIEIARGHVADLIGALSSEIIFTSGATEANNIALQGMAKAYLKDNSKNHIILSAIEHKSILNQKKELENLGYRISILPIDKKGYVNLEEFKKSITSNTLIVSIQLSNGEIGTIQNIKQIANICRSNNTLYHCDATQGLLSEKIDVFECNIDLLSFSSHKIHGPKGIGALFISCELGKKPKPIIFGGSQEQGIRPGTIPTMLCVGFGEACRILFKKREQNKKLLKKNYYIILDIFKNKYSITVNGDDLNRNYNNLNIQLKGIKANEYIMSKQPYLGISTSSACSSSSKENSHVLIALGLNDIEIESTIRIGIPVKLDTLDIKLLENII